MSVNITGLSSLIKKVQNNLNKKPRTKSLTLFFISGLHTSDVFLDNHTIQVLEVYFDRVGIPFVVIFLLKDSRTLYRPFVSVMLILSRKKEDKQSLITKDGLDSILVSNIHSRKHRSGFLPTDSTNNQHLFVIIEIHDAIEDLF